MAEFLATVLADVCYRLYGKVRSAVRAPGRILQNHLQDLFRRRLERGQCPKPQHWDGMSLRVRTEDHSETITKSIRSRDGDTVRVGKRVGPRECRRLRAALFTERACRKGVLIFAE